MFTLLHGYFTGQHRKFLVGRGMQNSTFLMEAYAFNVESLYHAKLHELFHTMQNTLD